ncbi:MAG: NUDIX hydrolase [Methylobacteriaceae bacterium]|jgi:8-oxo-dGTP pyrophosphatase MutT (NUDIX family)|nr:NUDIX hydrolase [Methylobacteriaceae bacterium]
MKTKTNVNGAAPVAPSSPELPDHTGTLDQYAALPYKVNERGELKVLLITSRDTHRWVLPKGWPKTGKLPCQTAQLEAWEEAGLIGPIALEPVGFYRYNKRMDTGTVVCNVAVFPLAVESRCAAWPEKGQRQGNWLTPEEAAGLVEEPELAELLRDFTVTPDSEDTDGADPLRHARALFS